MLYNDHSSLQNHACASLFKLIGKVEDEAQTESIKSKRGSPVGMFNRKKGSDEGQSINDVNSDSEGHERIISHLQEQDYVRLRRRIIESILKTDMVYHFDLLTRFQKALAKKTISKNLFCGILVHGATLSNTVRFLFIRLVFVLFWTAERFWE